MILWVGFEKFTKMIYRGGGERGGKEARGAGNIWRRWLPDSVCTFTFFPAETKEEEEEKEKEEDFL